MTAIFTCAFFVKCVILFMACSCKIHVCACVKFMFVLGYSGLNKQHAQDFHMKRGAGASDARRKDRMGAAYLDISVDR